MAAAPSPVRGSGPRHIRAPVALAFVVIAAAGFAWLGWVLGVEEFTRLRAGWPRMTPWSALLLVLLALALLLQLPDARSAGAVFLARSITVAVAAVSVVMLYEYASGTSLGIDNLWFAAALHRAPGTDAGRISPQGAITLLLLALCIGVVRQERSPWRQVWAPAMAVASLVPVVTVIGYLFGVDELFAIGTMTGLSLAAGVSYLLLVLATVLARPDRAPVAWYRALAYRLVVDRFLIAVGGLPLVAWALRLVLRRAGASDNAAWVLSLMTSVLVVAIGVVAISVRQLRELRLRLEASDLLMDSEEHLRTIVESAPAGIAHLTPDRRFIDVNPALCELLGYPAEWLLAHGVRDVIDPADDEHDAQARAALRDGRATSVTREACFHRADGRVIWVQHSMAPVRDVTGRLVAFVSQFLDVTEARLAREELDRHAKFDALTGLLNRREVLLRMATPHEARVPGGALAVLFCDIDHFKEINDAHGHAAGDAVLRALADRVRDVVRADDVVARMGGDELLVLLPGMHELDEATHVAETVRRAVASPVDVGSGSVTPTMSIGVTMAHAGEDPDVLLARADRAMYDAKKAGRDRVTAFA